MERKETSRSQESLKLEINKKPRLTTIKKIITKSKTSSGEKTGEAKGIFLGKRFFLDIVDGIDHQVLKHYYFTQISQEGGIILKTLGAKNIPDYLVWKSGLKQTLVFVKEHPKIQIVTPDWVSRCLFLNELVDVQSNPSFFVSEWDLYYEMNNALENYKACKPNEKHDWYPYFKESMELERKNRENKGVKVLNKE